jgi:hypothetical protein
VDGFGVIQVGLIRDADNRNFDNHPAVNRLADLTGTGGWRYAASAVGRQRHADPLLFLRRQSVVTCPYCNQAAMPLWRKCILGPETTVACSTCGKKIGVPWGAVASAVPIALGLVGAARLPLPWSVASLIGGLVAYVVLQRYAVPVVGRDA